MKVLERRLLLIVEALIQEEQCGFRPGHGTVDQLFTLAVILEGSWDFALSVYICFVDLEKAYDRAPQGTLWVVLQHHSVLTQAIPSLHNHSESCDRMLGSKSDSVCDFHGQSLKAQSGEESV